MNIIKRALKHPIDIYHYFIGNLRYYFYTHNFKLLIRRHILEQIRYREQIINIECKNNGACIHCGCNLPELMFANKACGGNCYLPMMGRRQWNRYESLNLIVI